MLRRDVYLLIQHPPSHMITTPKARLTRTALHVLINDLYQGHPWGPKQTQLATRTAQGINSALAVQGRGGRQTALTYLLPGVVGVGEGVLYDCLS